MTEKYAVLNPYTGLYTRYDDLESCLDAMADQAVTVWLQHTHGAPYTVIAQYDDGSETWASPQGETLLSPEQLRSQIKDRIKRHSMIKNDGSGSLPITILGAPNNG